MPRSVEVITSKAELTVQVQKLREKASKLKRKLADPKATEASKQKWNTEMAQTIAALDEAGLRRGVL